LISVRVWQDNNVIVYTVNKSITVECAYRSNRYIIFLLRQPEIHDTLKQCMLKIKYCI